MLSRINTLSYDARCTAQCCASDAAVFMRLWFYCRAFSSESVSMTHQKLAYIVQLLMAYWHCVVKYLFACGDAVTLRCQACSITGITSTRERDGQTGINDRLYDYTDIFSVFCDQPRKMWLWFLQFLSPYYC